MENNETYATTESNQQQKDSYEWFHLEMSTESEGNFNTITTEWWYMLLPIDFWAIYLTVWRFAFISITRVLSDKSRQID